MSKHEVIDKPVSQEIAIERNTRNADARKIVVLPDHCRLSGVERVVVFHQVFPELRIAGTITIQAARQLESRLRLNLSSVSDPIHREPACRAIADVRAFINRQVAQYSPQRSLPNKQRNPSSRDRNSQLQKWSLA